jgi:hypothetical protein
VRASDVVGFAAFAGFGLWWILFPTSVIRLYAWFHRGKARLPGPRGVRLAGAFWVCVVAVVFWASRGQWSFHS